MSDSRNPLDVLRYHVTGAIERGEAEPITEVAALDPYYNEIPETRGTSRTKGTFNGPTGRDDADAAKLAAFLAQKARDNEAR